MKSTHDNWRNGKLTRPYKHARVEVISSTANLERTHESHESSRQCKGKRDQVEQAVSFF